MESSSTIIRDNDSNSCASSMDSLEVESMYDSDEHQEYVPQEYEIKSEESDNELWMLESSLVNK